MKLIIFTAEPSNYVPVNLAKAAETLGIEACVIDVTKTVLIEELAGKEESTSLKSQICYVEDGKLVQVMVDQDTAVIPRLNEYHLDVKLGMLRRMQHDGAYLLNSVDSMALCNDKLMSQVILNTAGIKTPYSVVVQGIDEIEAVVKQLEEDKKITYPFVIKTLRGTHGIGVMKVDGRSSLVSVAQTLAKEGIDFMLQEFCEHKQSARIIMIGDKMLAANLRGQPKDKDEFRTNSHLGSETEKYEPSEDELAAAKRIVELFGCNFCAIDYLVTEDKQLIVLEVNGSPGLENIQKNWPDTDLAKTVVEYVAKQKNFSGQKVDKVEVTDDKPAELPSDALNEVEPCVIHRILDKADARIDTGARYCSLHVDKVTVENDWVKFKRGDITYKVPVFKTVKIKNVAMGESVPRPVVKLDMTLRDTRLNQVEFTLNDRSTMKY